MQRFFCMRQLSAEALGDGVARVVYGSHRLAATTQFPTNGLKSENSACFCRLETGAHLPVSDG